jgi:carboxypeptidase T
MLKKKVLALALSLAVFVGAVDAQEKYSKVIIYPASSTQRTLLIGEFQIDHFMEAEGGIVSEISARSLAQLKARGIKHRVLVSDVAESLRKDNARFFAARKKGIDLSVSRVAFEQGGSTIDNIIKKPADFEVKSTFGGYYSFAEMESAMNVLVSNYGSIAQKVSIGKTYEGRDIWLIKISDNVATDELNEPEVLYMGLQHAREAITGASMIFFMQYLCENYSVDSRIRDLVNNRELYIIPCFNPDGWEYNRNNGGEGSGWRKNRVPHGRVKGQDEFGVDLNRNWGIDWGNCDAPILGSSTSCGSSDKADDTYFGASAFSEKETQAVRDFVKTHHIVAGFDQHAYGPYYSLPFGRKSLGHTMPQKGQDFYTAIPALMGTYNGMRAADSYDALGYEVAGGFKDWMLMGEIGAGTKDTVWAMTGEGAAGGGTGGTYGSFWAPASQIVYLSKGMCYQNLQLAYAAGTYVDLQDAGDMALTATSGSMKFQVKRLGLGNDPLTISLIPLENVQSVGSAVTIPSMVYYGQVNGNITYQLPSSISSGQQVKFIWNVSTTGYSYSDTVVKVFNPTVLVSDNMEGSDVTANWVVSGGWNYSADGAFSGTKSLTESPGGLYSASSTRIAKYNKTVDLSDATAAYLTFWTRHRAENFRDKLQVQVSTNGGTSWTAIAGKTTIQEAGTLDGSTLNGQPSLTGVRDYWSQEVFDLSGYKVPIQFQLVFTSDSDPSSFKFEKDDGFYIDNLQLLKSTAVITPLPVTFMHFNGRLLPNQTVQLDWQAQTDDEHSYFEVERSADGVQFTSLGRSNPFPPYQFVDPQPKFGNNFYRIKQVDKSGKISYSKTVMVSLGQQVTATLYPNPVSEILSIKVKAQHSEPVTLKVTDLLGKEIFKLQTATLSENELKIDVRSWKSQFYMLTLYNSKEEMVGTQKFVKQ